MTSVLDVSNYKEKFPEYPSELQEFADAHSLRLPGLDTYMGQAIALMGQPGIRGKKHLKRPQTDAFFKQIGMPTKDSIQPFNKCNGYTGLKRVKARGKYCLIYPFECDTTDIDKRKGCSISGDRNTIIDLIKKWWRENLTDVPNDQWEEGHLDPTIPDGSEKNLAYQPPIQGKYRNRFKWDSIFHRMWPTGNEWISKMDEYHTEAEQKEMLAALKKKFEK